MLSWRIKAVMAIKQWGFLGPGTGNQKGSYNQSDSAFFLSRGCLSLCIFFVSLWSYSLLPHGHNKPLSRKNLIVLSSFIFSSLPTQIRWCCSASEVDSCGKWLEKPIECVWGGGGVQINCANALLKLHMMLSKGCLRPVISLDGFRGLRLES